MPQFEVIELPEGTRYLLPHTVDGKNKVYKDLITGMEQAAISQLRTIPNLRLAIDFQFWDGRLAFYDRNVDIVIEGWAGFFVAMKSMVELQFFVNGDEHISKGELHGWKVLKEGEPSRWVDLGSARLTEFWPELHLEFAGDEDYNPDCRRPAPTMSLRARESFPPSHFPSLG
jgi:hypothetical protein